MSGECEECGEHCLECRCIYSEKDEAEILFIDSIRWHYFEYMLTDPKPDYREFKRMLAEATEELVEYLHQRYCDHLEGLIKERSRYEHR